MSELGRRLIDARTIAMLRELEAEAAPAPWANRYHRKHVTTADWKHYLPILAECDTFENGDFIAEARNHLTALLDEIERLQASLKTAHDELLRVRTRGHGAAHELDNIAVEAGLGANPQPGAVAAYVRALRDVVWLSQGGREPGGGRAMMDLTKWMRLWEKDDAMWPRYDGHRLLFDDGKVGYRVYINDRVGSPFARLSDDAAVALIRDKAVWWLAGRGYEVIWTNEVNDNDEPFMGLCLKTAESLVGFSCTDPTEALYLACCKVLGVEP